MLFCLLNTSKNARALQRENVTQQSTQRPCFIRGKSCSAFYNNISHVHLAKPLDNVK